MKELSRTRADEIRTLHDEIIQGLRRSLERAIRIGELLTEQKTSMQHGQFGQWIAVNLPFTDRTARNYMRCYRERDRLKTETISDLTNAYLLLREPEPKQLELIEEEQGGSLVDLPADELREFIHLCNEDIDNPRLSISLDTDWWWKHFGKDGSFSERDMESFPLAFNIYFHVCVWRHIAHYWGVEHVPPAIRKHYVEIWHGAPLGEKPKDMCGEFCQFNNKEVCIEAIS